ncbi:GNAT family N-acetyltransferase [Planomonospora sp. ID91781]|uniref:GCN5 family acetyltransferase n=1 Tax=Planomonospora sphaerica TaxID=161355 RepID=A0A171D7T6_9ACTN|nr:MULTISPECIES: GNAT family protein [Planomonospora]MBG0820078.1 GNAT family N-acetyltransferase [Planomonospora sp. ID91781]GAT67772.1 GCN5 family acetyltransferase [Planomonospora sphaerica]
MEQVSPAEKIVAGSVVLHRVREADAEGVAAAISESIAHLQPWMPWAHDGHSVEDALGWIRRAEEGWAGGTEFAYVLRPADGGPVVGSISLMARVGPGALEIGYWLHGGHTGRGHMTAAAGALTAEGLALPGIERIVIKHDAANHVSGAVPRRLGYREVGRVPREPVAPAETGVDVVWEIRRG